MGCSTNTNPVPNPDCPPGFYKAKNKKNEECCYKSREKAATGARKKKSPVKQPSSPPKKASPIDEDLVRIENQKTARMLPFRKTPDNHDILPNEWVLPTQSNFASWTASTFIGYTRVRQDDEKGAECEIQSSDSMQLFPHQRFVRDYLQYKSPFRGLLVYHGLGVGKSCTSIAAAELLMNYKKVVIMLPASLRTNYINEIAKCGNTYYNKEKNHWVFVPGGTAHYISQKVAKANKGVWVIDETKSPNYQQLSEHERDTLNTQLRDVVENNYEIINYNGISEQEIKERMYNKNYFDNKVVVIDEAHNFIEGVSNDSKITTMLYKLLMKAQGLKIILLTGTPIINKPNEIAYAINLIKGYEITHALELSKVSESAVNEILGQIPYIDTYSVEIHKTKVKVYLSLVPRPFYKKGNMVRWNDAQLSEQVIVKGIVEKFEERGIHLLGQEELKFKPLPSKMEEFNKYFVDEGDNSRMINTDLFMRRIMGAVSHFTNDDPRLYPSQNTVHEEVFMSDYQYEKYILARQEEKKLESKAKKESSMFSTPSVYMTYSRTVCNFVFPEGIDRPKPKDIEVSNEAPNKKDEYERKIKEALAALTERHLDADLETYSPKFVRMMQNVRRSPGTILIYSQFSTVEGVELISRVLESVLGYEELKIKRAKSEGKRWDITLSKRKAPMYVKFKPDDSMDNKSRVEYTNIMLSIYNNEFDKLPDNIRSKLKGRSNLRGDVLRVLFVTQSGAEGISLKNVRQVHVTEPYWNKNRIDQVIGRANRTCSHIALPESERNFTVYTYTMKLTENQLAKNPAIVKRSDKGKTTDELIYAIAERKYIVNSQFLIAMQKAAVDCPLNNAGVGCFSFPVDFPSKRAYTMDIAKDVPDNLTKQNVAHIQKVIRRITIKGLNNRSFIYVESTGELFDNALYINTGVLMLVGHMKLIDKDKFVVTLKQ